MSAHSYQLFYRGFARKAFGAASPLAPRYRLAGIAIPAVMVAFFGFVLSTGNLALLGIAGNLTLLASGWHYAKQGFGILMLDAARKGVRFSAGERRRLLWNTHLVWLAFWLLINDTLAPQELWGITYYLIRRAGSRAAGDPRAGRGLRPRRRMRTPSGSGGRRGRSRSTASSPTRRRCTRGC